MTKPIFILARTPDAMSPEESTSAAIQTVEWTDICHGQKGKQFVFIHHEPGRNPSRWTYAENKRPFVVYTREWHKLGASSTLVGAIKIARREA